MSTDIHQIARQQLQALADGQLAPDEQRALARHLAGCPDCQAYAARLQALEARLSRSLQRRWPLEERAFKESPPSDLPDLLREINASTRRNSMQPSQPRSTPVLAYLALVVLIVLVISFSVRTLTPGPAGNQPAGTTQPASEVPAAQPSQPPASPDAPQPTQNSAPYPEPTGAADTACETVDYTVVAGDTFSRIADAYGLSAQAILDYNGLQPQDLMVGQTLKIPLCERAGQPEPGGAFTAGPSGLFPQVQFDFAGPLPDAPSELTVYRLALGEALTPENALSAAQALGLDGRVFSQASEGMNDSLYVVSDGYGLARFLNFPTQFLYWPGTTGLSQQHGELPPFEQQAAAAEHFLQARGLLDQPYRIEPLEGERGGVAFQRLLDGLPVISGIGVNRSLIEYNHVIVDAQGQALQVTHSQPGYEPQGLFPVLSAGQAWARLSDPNALARARYAVLDPQAPDTYQTWLRQLPRDQPLDLYGYADVMTPASGDPTPLVLFRDLPVSGAIAGMQVGNFLHVQGQVIEDASGRPVLQVTSWRPAELEDTNLEGELARSGETSGTLTTGDGQSLVLNDLPADLPDGAHITARGVVVEGVLDWSAIDSGGLSIPYGAALTCGGGGGGGSGWGGSALPSNFGEGQLALPNLSGLPATATPAVEVPGLPAVGARLEGLTGMASVTIRQFSTSSQWEVNLTVDAGVLGEYPVYLRLEGAALGGIEAYQNLPVRIWGQVARHSDYQAVVQVERYEPAYPGLQIQAWLGSQTVATLEGQQVVLFTAQDGSQYVLRGSLLYGTATMVGRPGDPVLFEGLAIPGESFGGYPLLRELSGSVADGITDLSGYQITQNAPAVIDGTQSEGNLRQELSGKATITQVELAYAAISTNHCTAADDSNADLAGQLLVQPIWVFSGAFEDGRRIEIQVAALTEAYFGP